MVITAIIGPHDHHHGQVIYVFPSSQTRACYRPTMRTQDQKRSLLFLVLTCCIRPVILIYPGLVLALVFILYIRVLLCNQFFFFFFFF